jgi:hypothetical protein
LALLRDLLTDRLCHDGMADIAEKKVKPRTARRHRGARMKFPFTMIDSMLDITKIVNVFSEQGAEWIWLTISMLC